MESKTQMEIERKYLVDLVGALPESQVSDIYQTYLVSTDGSVRRIRCRCAQEADASPRYYYTAKQRVGPDRSIEHEEELTEARYRQLMDEADPAKGTIHKQRTVFHYQGQCLELDRFITPTLDHLMLEIEGADGPEAVTLPPFLRVVEDVTGKPDYTNNHIASRAFPKVAVREQVSLLPYNTFGIDVKADRFVSLACIGDYRALLRSGLLNDSPFFILGGGSNVVFTHDYHGTVIHPENKGIRLLQQHDGYCWVEAEAGEVWDDFVRHCIAHQWYGLENLAAIPGCVGAAPVQNVGAYGREAKDVIDRVHCFDIATGVQQWIDAASCTFGYRWSAFKGEWKNRYLIDRVVFKLSSTFEPHLDYKALVSALAERGIAHPTAQQVADTVTAVRDAKLPNPKVTGSAGSFFKNPVVPKAQAEQLREQYPDMVCFPVDASHTKLAAGWLIEHCGWKGRALGRAGVYPKQALVLVNNGGCSGAEVRSLADTIISDVFDRFGITLECEAIFV